MNAIAIGSMWLSFLPFYRVDFPVDLVPKEFTYVEYNKGREVSQRSLSEKESHALKEFFVKNKAGWRSDLTTYAPSHLFASATMKVDCFGNGGVVVNYVDKDKAWVQLSIKESVGTCPASILDDANDGENIGSK